MCENLEWFNHAKVCKLKYESLCIYQIENNILLIDSTNWPVKINKYGLKPLENALKF